MAHALSIDTLEFANRLKKAGVSEKQAEVHVQLLKESFEENVATKADVQALRVDLENKIDKAQLQITIRIGALLTVFVGILATLQKIL